MAKITMEGLDEYTKALSRLQTGVKDKVIGPAIYQGAEIVADRVRAEIQSLPVDGGHGTPANPLMGPNQIQKDALLASFGISRMQEDDGVYNVKLGFEGYNPIRTRRWPNGQPNAMIARAIERGTSFLQKNPFMKRATGSSKIHALEAMKKSVERDITDIMNGNM